MSSSINIIEFNNGKKEMIRDILDRISEEIDSPQYSDIKAFLRWYSTCKYLMGKLESKYDTNLLSIFTSKFEYVECKPQYQRRYPYIISAFYFINYRNFFLSLLDAKSSNDERRSILSNIDRISMIQNSCCWLANSRDQIRKTKTIKNLEIHFEVSKGWKLLFDGVYLRNGYCSFHLKVYDIQKKTIIFNNKKIAGMIINYK